MPLDDCRNGGVFLHPLVNSQIAQASRRSGRFLRRLPFVRTGDLDRPILKELCQFDQRQFSVRQNELFPFADWLTRPTSFDKW